MSTAVLMAGLASAIAFSVRAGDPTQGPFRKSQDAAGACLQMTRELQCAIAFNNTICSANRVEFTVPDMNRDGTSDTIRYSWSGIGGQPLLRTFNGGTAQTFLPDMHAFTLRYRTKIVPPAMVLTESGETQFLNQNASNSGSVVGTLDVLPANWIGEFFKPALPAGTVSWRITRVQFHLADTGSSDGTAFVQVRATDASGKPSANILGQAVVSERYFLGDWYTVNFSNASGLKPSEGACVNVGVAAGSGGAGRVKYSLLGGDNPETYLLTSTDNGVTWAATKWSDVWLRVWGTITTSNAGTGPSTYLRTGIEMDVQTSSSSRTAVSSSVSILNRPPVSGP